MTIYRGPGGTGEARTDSDVTEVRIIADEAEGYKDQAATSASAAASSASAAATAETNAETAEANAETAEANAEAAQAAAEAAQAAAEAAQTAAEAAQTAAELAETNAETAEANAETAEANAETAQAAAEAALASAQAVYDNFDDRYLGAKTSNPTVDNDGNALLTGAMYFNTAAPEMRVYNGSVWQNFSAASAVSSFNTRTGAVTLSSSDVTTALGYTPVQTETDPVYVASSWYSTTNNASNWNTAYGWGNHASAGYATDSAVVKLTGSQTIEGTKTFSNNAVISVTDNTNAALRVTQLGTGNALLVEDTTNPDSTPFVVDAGGVVLRGITSAVSTQTGQAGIQSASIASYSAIAAGATATNGGTLDISRSRGSVASPTIVSSGDTIGRVSYGGYDGAAYIELAKIEAVVDGTPGTNDMPGRLVFSTTADGAASPTERMRIDNAGVVTMLTGALEVGSSSASTAIFDLQTSATGRAYIRFQDTDTNVGTIEYDHTTDSMSFRTNDVDRVFIDSSGNVGVGTSSQTCALDVVGGIKTSRTAVTSPASTDGNVFSGTYTPSLTNTTNLTASTPSACQYIRVGNTVTVSGQVSGITMTAAASTSTVLKMTLPIASALASTRQVGGTAVFYSAASRGTAVAIYGDITNDIAELNWAAPTTTASQAFAFSFTYQVL